VTLVELVITISISSIVVAFMAIFIVTPMNAYSAQARRAELVDDADSALRFVGRDLRASLPNSVRVAVSGSVTALLISRPPMARLRRRCRSRN
jgi:MSHA biogenesis protein MshO